MLEWILNLDYSLFRMINQEWTSPAATWFFSNFTDFHKTLVFKLLAFPAVLYWLFKKYPWRQALLCFVFMFVALGVPDVIGKKVIKESVQRERPVHVPEVQALVRAPVSGYSFISNHAANSFALATFCVLVFSAKAAWLLGIAALVGYSRIYCGVHFPTDVLAGALFGVMMGILVAKLYLRLARTPYIRQKTSTP